MNVKQELADAKKRQQEVVDRTNLIGPQKQQIIREALGEKGMVQIEALDHQRELLLQEALKIEGEIRVLKRMDGDGK